MKPDASQAAFDAAMLDKAQRTVTRMIAGEQPPPNPPSTPPAPPDLPAPAPADPIPPPANVPHAAAWPPGPAP